MAAELLPLCLAQYHYSEGDAMLGRGCTREEGHDGAHYGLLPFEGGYRPICWSGDDRSEREP